MVLENDEIYISLKTNTPNQSRIRAGIDKRIFIENEYWSLKLSGKSILVIARS